MSSRAIMMTRRIRARVTGCRRDFSNCVSYAFSPATYLEGVRKMSLNGVEDVRLWRCETHLRTKENNTSSVVERSQFPMQRVTNKSPAWSLPNQLLRHPSSTACKWPFHLVGKFDCNSNVTRKRPYRERVFLELSTNRDNVCLAFI